MAAPAMPAAILAWVSKAAKKVAVKSAATSGQVLYSKACEGSVLHFNSGL